MLATVIFALPFIIGGALTLVGAWVVYRYVPETVHRAESSAVKVHRAVQPVDGKWKLPLHTTESMEPR
jgi:hypothetical protein